MKTLAVYSLKGGVGKTTLAVNLAWAAVALSSRKTLLWDLDPQGAATFMLDAKVKRSQEGAQAAFARKASPTDLVRPTDVDRLMIQLNGLVDAGNSVVMVEHDMRVVAGADHVIDVGPGAGSLGGTIVAAGRPEVVAQARASRTAPYLREELEADTGGGSPPRHSE